MIKDRFVAKQYAAAFYPLIKDKFSDVLTILEAFSDATHTAEDLLVFFDHPVFNLETKRAVLSRIPQLADHPDVLKFIVFLIQRKRLNLLSDICRQMRELDREQRNILAVVIASSSPMAEGDKNVLVGRIAEVLRQPIEPHFVVDERLIAGVVIQNDDIIIDTSLASALQGLRKQLLSEQSAV